MKSRGWGMVLRAMFSRRWLGTSLLVLLGAAVCVRLGFWQLDRLAQRRAFNAHVEAMWAAPPLSLPEQAGEDLTTMEYRSAEVEGEYDFEHQVALRNRYWRGQPGYHLLTPLVMADGHAILVERGWIPAGGNAHPEDWRKYDEPGTVRVRGIIRLGQSRPDLGGVPDPELSEGQERLDFWNLVNPERVAAQVPYPLLPVYLQLDPDPNDVTPPIPYQPEIELSEGPHLGYAGQWFTFAALLLFGYPFYLRKRLLEEVG
ncbi:MAG: SURF1 family protein [Anaerolineae bacterium]|nr:MAG: SURF1 family protein [Anaerolineae bacterium]